MWATNAVRVGLVVAFAWVAWRDYRDRRVPGGVWRPLFLVGVLLLAVDGVTGRVAPVANAAVAFVFMVALARVLTYAGEWGGADTQAYAAIAVLYPVAPLGTPTLTVFPVAVLANSFLLAGVYLVGSAVRHRSIPEGVPFLVPTVAGLVVGIGWGGVFALVRFY